MSIKIDNWYPNSDTIVLTTKHYEIVIQRDAEGKVHIEIEDDRLADKKLLILGEQTEFG